jgi:hypothetical protein
MMAGVMARRSKGPGLPEIAAQGIAVLFVLAFLRASTTGDRGLAQAFSGMAFLFLAVVGLALVAGLIWIVAKFYWNRPAMEPETWEPPKPVHFTHEWTDISSPPRGPIKVVPASPVEDDSRYQPKPQQPISKPKPRQSISQQIRQIDWFQFEKLMELAYSGTGSVTRKGGANPDGGIDLVLNQRGGSTGIQCKHWKSWNVGVRVVREMIGALADAGMKKGIIVSLNPFTQDAIDLAARHNIELVGEQGVIGLLKYLDQKEVQRLLTDTRKYCPRCESEMVIRTASKGTRAGSQFWGCLGYPGCSFTMEI